MKQLITIIIMAGLVIGPRFAFANCGNGNGNGNGCSGQQGPAGPQGPQGPQGEQGPQGPTGSNGQIGSTGSNGKDANVETRVVTGGAVRLASEKYFDVESFVDYDLTNGKVGFYGMRVIVKPGKSYEERQLEKLKKELKELQNQMAVKLVLP